MAIRNYVWFCEEYIGMGGSGSSSAASVLQERCGRGAMPRDDPSRSL